MKALKIKNKLKETASNRKVQFAVALAVVSTGFLIPNDAETLNAPVANNCMSGDAGDCVLITDGNMHCSAGDFWNDCT